MVNNYARNIPTTKGEIVNPVLYIEINMPYAFPNAFTGITQIIPVYIAANDSARLNPNRNNPTKG